MGRAKDSTLDSQARDGPRKRADVLKVVETSISEFFGTLISSSVPLVSAGLDSISATELTRVLGEQLNT